MQGQDFIPRIIDSPDNAIQVDFADNVDIKTTFESLAAYFSEMLTRGYSKWVINVDKIKFPSTSEIAFLISATHQARSKNGDLQIINASSKTRNNFVTFSPLSYLSLTHAEDLIERYQPEDSTPETLYPSNDTSAKTVMGDVAIPEVESRIAIPQFEDNPVQSKQAPEQIVHEPVETDGSLKRYYLRTESIASHLYKICDFIVEHSIRAGIEEKQVTKSKIAVYEACLNVIEHAYKSRPDNWIEVWVEYDASVFRIIIQDYGLSFDNERESKQYNVEAAMEQRRTGGFGLHIIERSMDEVKYHADQNNGNRLILTKYL